MQRKSSETHRQCIIVQDVKLGETWWSTECNRVQRPPGNALCLPGLAPSWIPAQVWRSFACCAEGSERSDVKFLTREDVTRCYKIWQDVTRCYKMLQDVTRCYKMLQDVTRCYKMLQGNKQPMSPQSKPREEEATNHCRKRILELSWHSDLVCESKLCGDLQTHFCSLYQHIR